MKENEMLSETNCEQCGKFRKEEHVCAEQTKPLFEVGQIVVMKGKKELPFRIIGRQWNLGSWFYQWNRRNAAAEHMIRALTPVESHGGAPAGGK